MKETIINLLVLLIFVAVCCGIAYILPLRAAVGLVILLQILTIVVICSKGSNGKA